ncbi:MAG: hypothetical protein ACKVII_05280 [Planctomycetales bacterium]
MTKREFPWPKIGDKLFIEENDSTERAFSLASIMWNGSEHAGAFKCAADMVIDTAQEVERGDFRSDLIHPVAYMYRHALELKLKVIVRHGVDMHCYSKSAVEKVLQEHSLAKLWTKVKQAIEHRWPDSGSGELKAVEAVINEMHQADQNGQKWRYATEKNGRPIKRHGMPQFVSLQSLRRTMDNVFTFLEACEGGIDDGLQAIRDDMY